MGRLKISIVKEEDRQRLISGRGRIAGGLRVWVMDRECKNKVFVTVDEVKAIMGGSYGEEGYFNDKWNGDIEGLSGERDYDYSEKGITIYQQFTRVSRGVIYEEEMKVMFTEREFVEGMENLINRIEIIREVEGIKRLIGGIGIRN